MANLSTVCVNLILHCTILAYNNLIYTHHQSHYKWTCLYYRIILHNTFPTETGSYLSIWLFRITLVACFIAVFIPYQFYFQVLGQLRFWWSRCLSLQSSHSGWWGTRGPKCHKPRLLHEHLWKEMKKKSYYRIGKVCIWWTIGLQLYESFIYSEQ